MKFVEDHLQFCLANVTINNMMASEEYFLEFCLATDKINNKMK